MPAVSSPPTVTNYSGCLFQRARPHIQIPDPEPLGPALKSARSGPDFEGYTRNTLHCCGVWQRRMLPALQHDGAVGAGVQTSRCSAKM